MYTIKLIIYNTSTKLQKVAGLRERKLKPPLTPLDPTVALFAPIVIAPTATDEAARTSVDFINTWLTGIKILVSNSAVYS